MNYKKIPTAPEVWAAIMLAHRGHMVVFSSFSAPDGDHHGNPDEGRMMTEFGFQCGDCPVIGADTRWDINREKPHERINERNEYWLCTAVEGDE